MYDLCRHLLASGRRCTQPAVTGTSYCRHHRVVKRTIADSVLPPQFHSLHKAIPFLYPEDRAAIQANCFLVLRRSTTAASTHKRPTQWAACCAPAN